MSRLLARAARRSVETAFLPARVAAALIEQNGEGASANPAEGTPAEVPEEVGGLVAAVAERVEEARTDLTGLLAQTTGDVGEWVGERVDRVDEWADEYGAVVGDVVHAVEDRVERVGEVVEEAGDLVEDGLGTHRRVWTDDDADHDDVEHAQIEVRGIDRPESDRLRRRLRRALEQLDSVHWAEVNAITGRVAVAFDHASPLSAVVSAVETVEEAHGVRRQRLDEHGDELPWEAGDRAEHPSDDEPIHRAVATIAGNGLGLAWTVVGRAARLPRVPAEIAALASVVDHNPWLRGHAQRVLGRRAAELVLPLASAAGAGASQGPVGIVVDIGHHTLRLSELRARKAVWEQREPEFYARPSSGTVDPPRLAPRPVPVPDGPVERWSRHIAVGSLAGFGATLAATRRPGLAADAFLAGIPKAAHLGREGFACQLGRTLAARGVVPLDAAALRRLDRVDTVVLDSDVLVTGRTVVGSCDPLVDGDVGDDSDDGGRADRLADRADRLADRAERLLDGGAATLPARDGDWLLCGLDDVPRASLPRGAITRARRLRSGGAEPLALSRAGEVVALVGAVAELDPGAGAVLAAVRDGGHRLVVAGRKGRADRLTDADARIPRGRQMGAAVRRLQADGAVVMAIGRRGKTGLAAADVGVGLTRPTGRPPWGADLVLGRELVEATTVIEAITVAAEVSRRSSWFALAGSSLGGLVSLTGPRAQAGSRCLAAVNGAAGAALLAGTWSAVELARRPVPRVTRPPAWHAMSPTEVLERLASSLEGLSEEPARQRARITRGAGSEIGPAEPFLAELANPLNPVLGVGAALSAAVGSMIDAALVLGLIGVNTAVGGIQRLQADRAVAELLATTTQQVRVVRDGAERTVDEDELVPGDVVRLEAGEPVPADCRLLDAEGLEVDESSLTGESLPVTKQVEPTPDAPVADRACMLYEDSTIAAGAATAVVVATGPDTELARSLTEGAGSRDSGVEERLSELTRRIVPGAGAAAAATAVAGLLRRWPLREVAGTGVSLAVAAVPEGLPFVASASQIAGARRLAERGAVVRNPRAIEALGRVDTLCVDKTGTLTEGVMRLRAVSDGAEVCALNELDARARAVLAVAVRATPVDEDGVDPTEQALLSGAEQAGVDAAADVGTWAPVAMLPFEASRGLSAVLGRAGGRTRLVAKGAPETLLPLCSRWQHPDGPDGSGDLDDEGRQALEGHADALARRGYRVLAVARRDASDRTELDADRVVDLELIGFVALADPVRPAAAAALAEVQRAGVRPVLVTGDHPDTAAAVAEELGFADGHRQLVGAELDELDDAELDARVGEATVIARVTPAQKVRVVEALQRQGRAVAMTGDGANDAAAIRLADVGVALGRRATAAARDAADLVVVDDRVETLIDALVEGRALWGSVRQALGVLVGGNLGEIGFTVIASLFSRGAPMTARQFLLVNLFTDLAPALAIAVRRPRQVSPERLLREGPEASLGSALNRDIAVRAVATAGGATAGWFAARLTGSGARASTVALVALVGSQLGQTVATGGVRQPLVLAAGAGSAAALAGLVQTPGLSHFFGCRPLGPLDWAQAIGAATVATAGAQAATWWLDRRDAAAQQAVAGRSGAATAGRVG